MKFSCKISSFSVSNLPFQPYGYTLFSNMHTFYPILHNISSISCVLLFWLLHKSCGFLVSRTGIEPTLPAVEEQSLYHWTTRKVPASHVLFFEFSSVAQSCLTLCDPMNHSTQGLPVHHKLLEFTHTHVHRVGDAIQPSHPQSFPSPPAPQTLPASGSFPISQLFT